jgi:Leucine Rich repeat
LGQGGFAAFADSTLLGQLTHLDLAGNLIGDFGIAALTTSPQVHGLRDLQLGRNAAISAEGAVAIADSLYLQPKVKEQTLRGLGWLGLAAIVRHHGSATAWTRDGRA